MASKEQELAIKIAARLDKSFGATLNQVNSKISSLSSVAKKAASVATGAFAAIKVGDFAKECVDAAMEFETSMSDVAKVVDGLKTDNGEFTQEYYEMADAITQMSKEIPMTTDELAQITAAAGQANVAKEDLMQFTETAAKMGTAFDTTAEQAGSWMATWRTALNLTQDQVEELGDQINYLGNTSSEDANKISQIITETGSLAKISGVAAKDLAALAAATTGIDANVAGTGLKNMFVALGAGESATDAQVGVLEKLGFTASEVAEGMQEDARNTMLSVLEAIDRLPAAEKEAAIKTYFGKESLNTVAVLAANIDNLKEQFNKVSDATRYAGSMEAEFEAKAATTANSVILVRNKIAALKTQIGNYLLPVVGTLIDKFGNVVDAISGLVSKAGPKIESFKQTFSSVVDEVKSRIDSNRETLDKVAKAASDIKNKLYEAFNSSSPIIAYIGETAIPFVVDAIINLLGAATDVYNFFNDNWTTIGPIAEGLGAAIAGIKMFNFAKSVVEATKALALLRVGLILDKAETLYLQALYAKDAIVRGASTVATYAQTAAITTYNVVCGIASAVTTAFGVAMTILTSPIFLVALAIAAVIAVVILLIKHWDQVKVAALTCWEFIKTAWSNVSEWFSTTVITPIVTKFGELKERIVDNFRGALEGIKSIFSGIAEWFSSNVIGPIVDKFNKVKSIFTGGGGDSTEATITASKVSSTIPKLAKGGIATSATFAEIGEGGEPEAVIPLSKLSGMLEKQTAEQNTVTQSPQIVYSPNYNFYGGTPSKEDIVAADQMTQDKFNRMMTEWQRQNRRTSFAKGW